MPSLYNHQNIAQQKMQQIEKESKGGILADEAGMGKTLTMCTFLKNNKIDGHTDLIVCPFSILKTWEYEFGRIYDSPKILIYHGINRLQDINGHFDFVITTYSIVSTGELNNKRWGRVVLDESHAIKNGLKKSGPKCAKAIYTISKKSLYNWCITATPFNNRVTDLAAQAHFIGTIPYNSETWWRSNKNNSTGINEWRRKYVIRRTKEGLLKKPIHHEITVSPTPQEEEIINILRENAAENFKKWRTAHGLAKISLQGKLLALIQKLRVITNSYYCGTKNLEADKVIRDNAKVERIISDLDNNIFRDPKKGVVIFSQFTSFLSVLEQVIKEHMVGVDIYKFDGSMNIQERDNVVSEFSSSRVPRVLLISLMAGGVGLSLHDGSSTVMLCEPYYNPFVEYQAEQRVHRLGQTDQVNVYRYGMENSVETWIQKLKEKKMAIAKSINLSKKGKNIEDFSMKDLGDLFANHVSFVSKK